MTRFGDAPAGLLEIVQGGRETGEALADDPRVPLVSATGSTRMGRALGPRVAARFGRSLLELGGNNAMIVAPSADLDLAERAIAFAAMGTAGQRCTTLRRLFVHDDVYDRLVPRLKTIWSRVPVGDPLEAGDAGRAADRRAPRSTAMQAALAEARAAGRQRPWRRADRGLLCPPGPRRDAGTERR